MKGTVCDKQHPLTSIQREGRPHFQNIHRGCFSPVKLVPAIAVSQLVHKDKQKCIQQTTKWT